MTFSPNSKQRFDKLLKSYPPGRQRSALIPMLLYAQDEVGAHHGGIDATKCAKRLGVTPLQVDEVIGYYSMLHSKPLGKYHVQVCTNISCLLHGGDELYEHACKKLGHRTQRSDGRRADLARRSGVHGRLLLGAGDPGELRFPPRRHAGKARPDARRPRVEEVQ